MRRPDFILKALDKATGQKSGKIGAGWQNENGSISLKVDMCVVLTSNPNLILTLFPFDKKEDDEEN